LRRQTDAPPLTCVRALGQERIIQECCTLLQCDRASLFLVDQLSGALELSLGKGIDKIIIPKGAGIAGHVATTGEILNVPEPYNDPRFNQQTDKDSGYLTKSILCVPVRDGDGRNIAVLQAINKLNGNTFSSDDQMVLEKLTMLAGISLRNAQLFEDSRTQQDKVQSLLDVIRTMSSNMGLNSIIFTITQRFPGTRWARPRDSEGGGAAADCPCLALAAIVEAQACTVYLIDAKRQQLWSVASDSGREFRVPIDAGIAGAVAMTGETINIAGASRFAPATHTRTHPGGASPRRLRRQLPPCPRQTATRTTGSTRSRTRRPASARTTCWRCR